MARLRCPTISIIPVLIVSCHLPENHLITSELLIPSGAIDVIQRWHRHCHILINNMISFSTLRKSHDDIIKWKHFPRNWPFRRGIRRNPHKGQWRGALMFSLICVWINDWVNNCEGGDFRRYRARYDVIVIVAPLERQELAEVLHRFNKQSQKYKIPSDIFKTLNFPTKIRGSN